MANRKRSNKIFYTKCDNLLDKHRNYIITNSNFQNFTF